VRILHIATGYTPVLPDSSRSVENTIYQLSKWQAELGHDVVVVDIQTKKSRGGTKARFCGVRGMSKMRGFAYPVRVILFSLLSIPLICRLMASGVDIIHTHSQFPTLAAVMVKKLLKSGVPIFYTAHSPYLTMPLSLSNRMRHTIAERWALRWADKVVAQTKTVGGEICRRFGLEPSKVVQVYAGVDVVGIDRYLENNRRNNAGKMVLYPAYVNRRKNQMAVAKAIPRVLEVEPDCEFVFAGGLEDGGYYTEILRFVWGRCPLSNVSFIGRIPRDELYQLYQDATVLVFPSLYETQGVVLLEAMAFGLPVVASDIGVVRDVVKLKRGCALLVDSNDSDAFADAIMKVLGDKALRGRLSRGGRELVCSRFTWERIAGDTIAKYEEALNGRAEFLGVCADAHPSR